MFACGNNRRALALGIGAYVGILLLLGGVWAFNNFDLERRRCDPERLEKLARTELPPVVSQIMTRDWPQWRGPNRDGLSIESDLVRTWPANGPPEVWRKSIGRGFSSVVVVGSRLYSMDEESMPDDTPTEKSALVSSNYNGGTAADHSRLTTHDSPLTTRHGGIFCLDAQTGKLIWHFRSPDCYAERFGSGPRSTPAVASGRVYAVGPTGFLFCLNADSGDLLWQHDLQTEFNARPMRYGVAYSPLVERDLVITTPGGPESRPGNAVIAFHKHTGAVVWKALDDTMGYSSPIAVTLAGVRQLLIFSNTELVSLSPEDGRVYWRYPWEAPGGFNIATPVAFGDCVFISSGYGKGCALLEITREPDGSIHAHRVYEHNRMRNHFASSVRWGEHLYGFDQTDLVCMELRTGKIAWREKGFRSFGKGSLLIADGQLIVMGETGKLYLAEATPAGYREKASFQVSPNKCWTAPIVAQGKLYVRTESQIICLDLRQKPQILAVAE